MNTLKFTILVLLVLGAVVYNYHYAIYGVCTLLEVSKTQGRSRMAAAHALPAAAAPSEAGGPGVCGGGESTPAL